MIGLGISVLTAVVVLVAGLLAGRYRRVARKNSELEELREVNLAAMGYIYRLELAAQEAAQRLGTNLDFAKLDKPEILKRSYLAEKAEQEGNREIEDLVKFVDAIQVRLKEAGVTLPVKE